MQAIGHVSTGSVSDYGSDLDTDGEDAVYAILTDLETNPIQTLAVESLLEDHDSATCVAQVPKSLQDPRGSFDTTNNVLEGSEKSSSIAHTYGSLHSTEFSPKFQSPSAVSSNAHRATEEHLTNPANHISPAVQTYKNTAADSLSSSVARFKDAQIDPEPQTVQEDVGGDADERSPLERFRTAPKKPLSVTDMVSPAWCELQYWFTLTKHGRKLRTPAMKQGSKVHRVLEEQVHKIVPVTVMKREDGMGLRIWNVIQGLRGLRATDLTRELGIWGIIDDQVVVGVIDELSYTCPDPELEGQLAEKQAKYAENKRQTLSQKEIDRFFQPSDIGKSAEAQQAQRKIYLTDVKTRSKASIPSGSLLRPTRMQLMLYRKLLADLAANTVPADIIFARHNMDPMTLFSDSFVSEISALDYGSNISENGDPGKGNVGVAHELAQHNNLTLLWQLMIQEFQLTIPTEQDLGLVLRAEFRMAKEQIVIGDKCFAYDEPELQRFVTDEMKWWNGERAARGVDVEEAYKCRTCEFAEGCSWRAEKIDEAISRHRQRRQLSGTGS